MFRQVFWVLRRVGFGESRPVPMAGDAWKWLVGRDYDEGDLSDLAPVLADVDACF